MSSYLLRIVATAMVSVCMLLISGKLVQALSANGETIRSEPLVHTKQTPVTISSSEQITGQLYLPVVSGGEVVVSDSSSASIPSSVAIYPEHDTEPFDDEYHVTTKNFNISRVGRGPVPSPQKSETYFVTDQSTYLDRYLSRRNVPNGKLPVPIPIDRYYSSLITSDSIDPNTGRLKDSAFDELVKRGYLPLDTTVYLSVYDVDHNATGCPEVDYLYVNGTLLRDSLNYTITLTSGDSTWSLVSYRMPTKLLKFPTSTGMTITNTVEIEIDAQCKTSWAIEVDWIALSIPPAEASRPFVFVHGWTGNGNTFDDFTRLMEEDRISYRQPVTYSDGISGTTETGAMLSSEILAAVADFGVDRVNIIAHSRGGLFIREAMRSFPAIRESIGQVFTLGSPHHGITGVQVWFGNFKCGHSFSGPAKEQCTQAVVEMSEDWVRKYNYGENCKLTSTIEQNNITISNPPIPPAPTPVPTPAPLKWRNCEPQYTEYLGYQAPSDIDKTDAFISFVHESDPAVPPPSAAYPWQVWDPDNAIPEPTGISVTHLFTFSTSTLDAHGDIKENQDVYECLMSYVDGRSNQTCPDRVTIDQVQMSSAQTPPSYDTIIWTKDARLNAGELFTTTVNMHDSTLYFQVLSAEPVEFVLTQPDGRVISQANVAAYSDVEHIETAYYDLAMVGFTVDNALPGIWTLSATAPAATDALFMVTTDSTLVLAAEPVEASYQAGDTARIESAFVQDGAILVDSNAIFTGSMVHDGVTVSLAFRDDGTEGDGASGDGVYTAQFIVPSTSKYIDVKVNATTNGLSRIVQTFVAVITQTATLGGVSGEATPDNNGNGLLDSLNVNVAVRVIEEGEFVLKGRLVDANGEVIAYATTNSTELYSAPLMPGNYSLPLVFAGRAIRDSGKNGPYSVDSLTIADLRNSTFSVDRSTASYITQVYAATDFEGAAFTLTSTREEAIDTNSDGRYNELRVQVLFKVLFPGRYNWNARLVDQDGIEIDWDQGSGLLDGSTPITLTFDGRAIATNAMDGPYYVQDLVVFQTSGGGASTYAQKAHTTAAFRYLDFDGAMPKIEFRSRTVDVVKGSGRHDIDVVLNAPLASPASTTLRTTNGTAIGGEDYLPISTTLSIAAGQVTITVPFDILDDGIRNGTESFRLEIGAPQGLLSGRNNPVTINILDFGPAAAISVLHLPVSLVADGISTGNATMLVFDEYGNPVSGETVYFSTNLGKITRSSLTDAAGVVTATVTSDTTAGTATILVTIGTVVHSNQINFVAGPPAAITLTAAPTSLMADGASTATLTAVVKDANGNPVPNQTVAFATTLGAITGAAVTDANGVATATLTSVQQVGVAQVTASLGSLSASAEVTFAGSVFAGVVFVDRNKNGVRDAGEPGIPNVTAEMTLVSLAASSEQVAPAAIGATWRTLSDANGTYRFADLPLGVYTLTLHFPSGYSATTPTTYTVTVGTGQGAAPEVGALAQLYLPYVKR